ncbi:hypothetical protein GLAREA_07610 [Glarea lozoyensis ATCC 20868]|uniref:Uncharacterized protein n=1 Tax=Glarea lozoyensis (strain ATCC 20868 / MF5171) TaxID=1116229 RepID=S3D1Q0_GLAL2|nr:uncharacterized protein GLAREA_07610 [Glarea lozoyensis ATCC 20868]EPE32477.1 hypothetical protein GLAREA_07610 [Glarea lozoyensis ATCC 20868]
MTKIDTQISAAQLADDDICQAVIATPPAQCGKNPWSAIVATQPFGNPSYYASINASCPSSIFNGTSDLIKTTSEVASPLSDTNTYDRWILQATSLVLVAFAKNKTLTVPRWGNSAMVCLTPDIVGIKSRSPSGAVQHQATPTIWSIGLGIWIPLAAVILFQ